MKMTDENELDTLVPSYALNKIDLDACKKLCDSQNARIKQLMLEAGETSHEADGFVAKRVVTTKETMNEERLLTLAKKHGVTDLIKTKEYIDIDALESRLYNGKLSQDFVAELASCKSSTEVVQLRISEVKNKRSKE